MPDHFVVVSKYAQFGEQHTLPSATACFFSFDRWRLISLSLNTEEKGTSPPDYRHYLRMWAKEKEAQKETIKDLPKMNQVDSVRIYSTCF